jgi:molybdenum cofactor cytidylyltransferase
MGRPKQLLVYRGKTLLRRAVEAAVASGCEPVVVVLGSDARGLAQQLAGLAVQVVVNDRWADGMGTSIRAGMAAVGDVDAVVIFLCDQPLVDTELLNRLVASHFQGGKPITAAFYSGVEGTPAVFSSSLFDELGNLENGQGGKALFARHAVQRLALQEAAVDVDTAADYQELKDRELD